MSCESVVFKEEGSTEFILGPMNPIGELVGKKVWFNTILDYTENESDLEVSFSDGTPFPVEAVDAYKNIFEGELHRSWRRTCRRVTSFGLIISVPYAIIHYDFG